MPEFSSVLNRYIALHYLDIVNTHDAPTVIHVLLQIFFLKEGRKEEVQIFRFVQYILTRLTQYVYTCTVQTLTRYSNTSVRHLSVWIMSWRVTILACFKSFRRDTRRGRHIRDRQSNTDKPLRRTKQLLAHEELRELPGNMDELLLYVPTLSRPCNYLTICSRVYL